MDSGFPPSVFRWVCLCMVSRLQARLIIKYCTIKLMSLFEIWTGIRSLEQVLLRTIITLICTECMYLNIHFYLMPAKLSGGNRTFQALQQYI